MKRSNRQRRPIIERLISWIGSTSSLIVHTVFFVVTFLIGSLHILDWSMVLLVLTTVVSLEAIYLAIFIQIVVNAQAKSLREVEKDVDDIQEDIEELSEDDAEDTVYHKQQTTTLETLTIDVKRMLADIETLKTKRR